MIPAAGDAEKTGAAGAVGCCWPFVKRAQANLFGCLNFVMN